jgi:hypothetical protein
VEVTPQRGIRGAVRFAPQVNPRRAGFLSEDGDEQTAGERAYAADRERTEPAQLGGERGVAGMTV